MAAENFKVKKGLEVGTGITANSDGVDVTGIVTATQFKGDGSGLTGVVGSGSGVVVKDEGSAVGTAGTINFVGSGVAASLNAGTATVTINSGGLSDVVADTTPQLGGNLDLNSKIINGSGNIDYTGNLKASGISTATGGAFFGNIQAGVGALNATIQKTDNGTLHLQYNKPGNLELCQGGGQVRVFNNFNVAGLSTMTGGAKLGNLSVGYDSLNVTIQPLSGQNTLHFNYNNGTEVRIGESQTRSDLIVKGDIEPRTNSAFDLGTTSVRWRYLYADSANITGIATFTSGVAKLFFSGTEKLTTTVSGITVPHINVSGIGTFGTRIDTNGVTLGTNATTFAAKFADNARAIFGGATNGDFGIYHDTNHSYLHRIPGGTGDIYVKLGGDDAIVAKTDSSVELYWDDAKKLATDQAGVIITGVATATSFSGSGAGLTNIPSAQLSGALPALDGSALTGVTASGSGVIIKHDGTTVGTAGTINFSTNLDVTAVSAGIVTVTASGSGSSLTGTALTLTSTDAGSSAEPIISLFRNSSSPADADYLGQIKFQGESDTGVQRNYAKITGKILDASNGTEDGIIEFAHIKAGSQNISARFRSDSLQLLNGTNLTVAGTTTLNSAVGINTTGQYPLIISSTNNAKMALEGSNNPYIYFREGTTNKGYIQWHSDGDFRLGNDESGEFLKIKSGADGLTFVHDGTESKIFHAGNDGASSGLDADLLDGQEGSYYTNATNLGSGTIPNGRFPATLPAVSGANLTNLPVPTQITVADESSDTSCNVLFSTAATGDLAPKSGTNLTFNSANGTLTATTFSGALSGNATSADTVDVTNDGSANTTFYPTFVNNHGSGKTVRLDTGLTYVPATNVLTAGTFSGSGASLTNIPAGNLTGTLPAISGANLTNLPASDPTNSDIQVVYTVTANGTSAYRFEGNGVVSTADDPDLYLIRGQKYRFINNSGGSHPFQIRVSSGGSAYNTGVTNNGAASGNIDFAPTYDSPAQLVYQCTSHGGMVGNIYIRGGSGGETNVGVTTMTGSGTRLRLSDSSILRLGNEDADFFLYHDGSSTDYISAGAGKQLRLTTNDFVIKDAGNTKTLMTAAVDGRVNLYYNNINTAFTDEDAFKVYGRTSNSGMIEIASNQAANNNDRFRIHKTSAGQRLSIQNYASGSWVENIRMTAGGLVELKHADGTTKMHTDTTGITVANRITASGDTNTYMNLGSTADTIELYTGGTNQIKMDSNGYLGIGLNDAHLYYSKSLVVNAGLQGDGGGISIKSGGTTHTNYLMFADSNSGADRYDGYVSYNHNHRKLEFAAAQNVGFELNQNQYLVKATGKTCAFNVRGGNMTRNNTSGYICEFNDESSTGCFDSGGDFNTSTYKFTAPVTGFYYFFTNIRLDNYGTGYIRTAFLSTTHTSGTTFYNRPETGHVISYPTNGSGIMQVSTSTVMSLTKDDEVYVYQDPSADNSYTVYLSESSFGGYFIG